MVVNSATARSGYHHGNLNEALVAAAIALIEDHGVEALSVREVAKRAGVSPGAPFRHFSSKKALLTAVAEQAMTRLSEAVQAEVDAVDADDPLGGLRAVGRAYLGWAVNNPTHFQIISSRTLIDFDASEDLVRENEAIRVLMADMIDRAQACGQLKANLNAEDLILAARAFAYGLARMWIDGHFPEWKISRPPQEAMEGALDMFVEGLRP